MFCGDWDGVCATCYHATLIGADVAGKDMDIILMYESAWKQSPGNEELGVQTFNANIRTGNWKIAQQVGTLVPSETLLTPM